jgi:hypothetical protein
MPFWVPCPGTLERGSVHFIVHRCDPAHTVQGIGMVHELQNTQTAVDG